MKPATLRYKVLVALAMILVPAGLLAGLLSFRLLQEATRAQIVAREAMLISTTRPIRDAFEVGARTVLTVTSIGELWTMAQPQCEQTLATVSAVTPMITAIALIRADGYVQCATPRTDSVRPLMDMTTLPASASQGTILVSTVRQGRLSDEPVVGQFLPIVRNGKVERIVWVSLKLREMQRILDLAARQIERPVALELADGEIMAASGTGPAARPDDPLARRIPVYGSMVQLRYAAPAGLALALPAGSALLIAVAPLVTWALTFLLVWKVISRNAVRPLEALKAAVSRNAQGAAVPLTPPEDAALEIRELATAVANMKATLDQREDALRAALAEQTALTREVHHRVRNNLQLLSSLINLEWPHLGHDDARTAMRQMQERVHALAAAHQSMVDAGGVSGVPMGDFLSRLSSQSAAGARVAVHALCEPPDLLMPTDILVPLSLLTQEIAGLVHQGLADGQHAVLDLTMACDGALASVHYQLQTGQDALACVSDEQRARLWRYIRSYATQMSATLSSTCDDLPEVRLTMTRPVPETADPAH